jgi:hypothetical protein
MLWNASAISGHAIEASDGQLGSVHDLLFEDVGWGIRWLVVDTGKWLAGRKVLLPPSALGQPDRARRRFPVRLTVRQVKDSPDIDTDKPVSRQIEAHVYNHYGWDPYWGSSLSPISNAIATPFPMGNTMAPFVAPRHLSDTKPRRPGSAEPQSNEGNPHLRSIAAVTGYHIHATDGEIGHVEDFLVDDVAWRIRYMMVDTRNWRHGEKVLIAPGSVREIDWADRLIHLDVDRRKVRDSPSYDPSITVDRDYEEKLLTYYGIRWVGE